MTDATGGPDPEWGKEMDEDPPRYRFATEFGFMELIPPRPFPADLPRPTPEEMRDAGLRYLRARYAQATDPWVSGQVYREDPEPYEPVDELDSSGVTEEYQNADLDGYPEGEREE